MAHKYIDNTIYFLSCSTRSHFPYFDTHEKKRFLVRQIKKAQKKLAISVFAYSMVSDHYHLLLYLRDGRDLGKVVQQINGASSYELNKSQDRRCSIWDQYWDVTICNESDLHKVFGYIIGNPLKHGVVKSFENLEKYPFSSFFSTVREYGKEFAMEAVHSSLALDLESKKSFKNFQEEEAH